MPKFNLEKNLDHGILFTTAGTKLPTNSETLENDAQIFVPTGKKIQTIRIV